MAILSNKNFLKENGFARARKCTDELLENIESSMLREATSPLQKINGFNVGVTVSEKHIMRKVRSAPPVNKTGLLPVTRTCLFFLRHNTFFVIVTLYM
ncbi:hypothetical protein KCP75_09275 [Salmonella enterica subsp. enterica]|nr:hypothetical protein KCP75_09275 [Salmonella enterica subsp. enterica]